MIQTRNLALVAAFGIMVLSMSPKGDVHAQSRDAKAVLDELLSTDKNIGLRWFPRGKLAESIAQDKTLSPKIRVDVLTAVLREEIENPCPMPGYIHGGHITPTFKLKRNYVRALVDVGVEAIPLLRPHLSQLELSVEEAAGDSEYQKWLKMEEVQHIRFALGLLGDMDVFPHVFALLEDDSADGYVRETAIRVLGKLKNDAAIPALTHALSDNFHVEHELLGHPRISYPVRMEAYQALRQLGLRVAQDYRGDIPHYQVLEPPKVGEIYKFLAASDIIASGTIVKDVFVFEGGPESTFPTGEFVASVHTVQVEQILYAEREIKKAIFFKDGADRADSAKHQRKPNRILFVDQYEPSRRESWIRLSANTPYLFFLNDSNFPIEKPESHVYEYDLSITPPKVKTFASSNESSFFEPAIDSMDSSLNLTNKYEKTWLPYVEVLSEAMSIPDWERRERRLIELSNDSDETLASNARDLLAILRERVQE